jgi:hypothetical protein
MHNAAANPLLLSEPTQRLASLLPLRAERLVGVAPPAHEPVVVRRRFLRTPTGFGDPAEVQLGLGGVEVVVRLEAPEVPLCIARPAAVEQQLADPVHDPVPVGVVQRLGRLASDAHRVLDRKLDLPPEAIAEAFALDIGHGVPEESSTLPRVEDRQNMGMVESRRETDFSEEAFGAERRC